MENGYSLSDIANATGGGFGGNNCWWIILLFFLIGGTGWNRSDYSAASQQEILFNQHFNNLDNKMDRGFTSIGNGIADATFALNNSIKDGNAMVAGRVVDEGRALQMQNCELKSAIHAEGEETRKMLYQNKIDSLTAQVSELKTQNMFCGIPRINPYGYQVVPYQNGCCNCGNF